MADTAAADNADVPKLRSSAGGDASLHAFLGERGHSTVARRGELIDPFGVPAVLADDDGGLVGALTYLIDGATCEVLTLHVEHRWGGVGTALLAEVARIATDRGCTRYLVTTTNDNVDALRFYQRRGFRIVEVRTGAVDEARRTMKPAIPLVGDHGIPLRDEIDLEQPLPLDGFDPAPSGDPQ